MFSSLYLKEMASTTARLLQMVMLSRSSGVAAGMSHSVPPSPPHGPILATPYNTMPV